MVMFLRSKQPAIIFSEQKLHSNDLVNFAIFRMVCGLKGTIDEAIVHIHNQDDMVVQKRLGRWDQAQQS